MPESENEQKKSTFFADKLVSENDKVDINDIEYRLKLALMHRGIDSWKVGNSKIVSFKHDIEERTPEGLFVLPTGNFILKVEMDTLNPKEQAAVREVAKALKELPDASGNFTTTTDFVGHTGSSHEGNVFISLHADTPKAVLNNIEKALPETAVTRSINQAKSR